MQGHEIAAISGQDSDFNGVADSKDPFPIIASYSVFKWEVNSASLDYDVQQTTSLGNGFSSESTTTRSIRGTFSWVIGADGRIESGIHGSVGLNANPFNGFGLSAGINTDSGMSASAYGQVSKAKTIDDNEINAQNDFFEIKDSEAIGNLHFTFSVNFRNFSQSPLIVKMASLPIVIGERHIADAKSVDVNSDGILELPPNRKEGVLVMFRADMNNTKALELVNWLKNGNSPTIDLARSALSVYAKNDSNEEDLVSRVTEIESHDSLLTIRIGDSSVSWRVAKSIKNKVVMLRQAMNEINKMLRVTSGANSDFFDFNDGGHLQKVADVNENNGSLVYWCGDTLTPLTTTNLDAPIPDRFTILMLPKDNNTIVVQEKTNIQITNSMSNLKQIGLAFAIWAGDHEDQYPFNVSQAQGGVKEACEKDIHNDVKNPEVVFKVMSQELGTTKYLVCPNDPDRQAATDFYSLSAANVSYQLRAVSDKYGSSPDEVLAIDPINGIILYCDGRVLKDERYKRQHKDGY